MSQTNYGGTNYQIQTGENNTNVFHLPAAAEAIDPPYYIAPGLGSRIFVGRDQQMQELHELLQQAEQLAITAATGMGGIGKTDLAWHYAEAHRASL